jgi:catechol-2,3-dioxygenase
MKILGVELLSDNLVATEEFYTGVLGLPLVGKDNDLVTFKAGMSMLTFKRSFNLMPVYHFAFNIPPDGVDEAFFWVSSKCPILPVADDQPIADFTAWNAKAFYFSDNNGNILEFIARRDLDMHDREPFTAAQILSISEIAIVTPDVSKYSRRLTKYTGVKPYPKQPPHSNFVALGNEEGLFIISETGRHWYPTDKPSAEFSTKVKIDTGETIKELSLNEGKDHPDFFDAP